MAVPDKHYAGDTLEFVTSVPDFPPSAGWTLKYRFIPRFTTPVQLPIDITATATADDEYQVLVGPDFTAAWEPGTYNWGRWVEQAGARQVLDDLYSMGSLEILLHPAFAPAGSDNRTQAQKALDDANAALAAFAASNGRVKRYSIAGREMEFETSQQLVAVRNEWQKQVNREYRRAVIATTGVDPNRVLSRF